MKGTAPKEANIVQLTALNVAFHYQGGKFTPQRAWIVPTDPLAGISDSDDPLLGEAGDENAPITYNDLDNVACESGYDSASSNVDNIGSCKSQCTADPACISLSWKKGGVDAQNGFVSQCWLSTSCNASSVVSRPDHHSYFKTRMTGTQRVVLTKISLKCF